MKHYFKLIVYGFVAVCFSLARADDAVDFFRAVAVDNAGAVSRLLAAGFDPNTADPKGQRGLHLALRDGAPRVAAALLAHPAVQVDAVNGNDETPLMMAALRGEMTVAQQLVARGAQVNRRGWTPMHYAATGPEPRLVAWLLEQGAAIDAPSPNGTTPLMMAARYGTEDAALLLLERGASPQARNIQGLDAAAFARLGGREKLALRLESARR